MLRAIGLALVLTAAASAPGPARAHPYHAPRTSWGAPDLQGVWSNASYTRLERPRAFETLVVTPQAARAYEARLAQHHGVPAPPPGADAVGQLDSEFSDAGDGLARIHGQLRTSWIVDPADGRLPYTAEARRRFHIGQPGIPGGFDNPEDRPGFERCVTSTGASPPLLSSNDTNLIQIFEAPGYVVLLSEKYHDARIIPVGAPRRRGAPRTWAGNSVGRWEGATLVVETEGFLQPVIDRWPFLFQSADSKVSERFTRTSRGEVLYEFAVSDPTIFTQTWRGEMLLKADKGPVYEDACHEGNYSIVNILAGARRLDGPLPVRTAAGSR